MLSLIGHELVKILPGRPMKPPIGRWVKFQPNMPANFPSAIKTSFGPQIISAKNSLNKISFIMMTDWEAFSWKGQLERTRSWKVSLKLQRAKRNWKETSEVGKNPGKLEWKERNWKEPTEVGKFFWSWNFYWVFPS